MESHRESIRLYIKLINNKIERLREIAQVPHQSQFVLSKRAALNYQTFYINELDNYAKSKKVTKRRIEPMCSDCKDFFINNQPQIDHENDLNIGAQFEDKFSKFLNSLFEEKMLPLQCVRADDPTLNMPDFKIVNTDTKEAVFYFEFKCIFKPFISIGSKIKGAQCYSQSLTLDCDEKLTRQKELIYSCGILNKTAYVYWYDIPCVKGVFWGMSKNIFEYESSADTYRRIEVEGDSVDGARVGHLDKIYLPLHNMRNFDSLVNHIVSLA
ncbi:hypothetical protein [Photobacterium leiognathi]|uniref:hypothetical protein n=1 Tax=Photobacterium leiognathi TaxID=553611 RepID=UPI0029826410|nr:hypothetical protein [Photobacterium leiognathi]